MPEPDELSHHGVKGMKWGVRKDHGHEGERVKLKKLPKLDKKFEKGAMSLGTMLAVHNEAAMAMNNKHLPAINSKWEREHPDLDYTKDSPLRQQYYKEHQDAYLSEVHRIAASVGTNPSGTKKLQVVEKDDGDWELRLTDVQHADGVVRIKVKYNRGKIVKIEGADAVAHEDMDYDETLEHYGIKGMHWGVRRVKNASGDLVEVQSHKNPIGQVYKTSGGENHPTHPDAEKAMRVRQQAKSSGLHSLSNDEIRAANDRMNLEMNYVRAVESRKGKSRMKRAQEFTKSLLGLGTTANDAVKFANSPAGQEMQKQFGKTPAGKELTRRSEARKANKNNG